MLRKLPKSALLLLLVFWSGYCGGSHAILIDETMQLLFLERNSLIYYPGKRLETD